MEEVLTRVGYFAHLHFATDMADPSRGALVSRVTEKGAALDTQLLFFGLEIAEIEDDAAEALLEAPELEHWHHWIRSLRKFRPHLLSEPEEKIVTEKSVSGVSAWGRCTRSSSARSGWSSTERRPRSRRRCRSSTPPTGTSGETRRRR